MPIRQRYNRILVLWLLLLLGCVAAPARSFASCDMRSGQPMAANRACCIHKTECACETPASVQHQTPGAALPDIGNAGCPCVTPSQPASPTPKVEPIRHYIVAALPTRAGPIHIGVSTPTNQSTPLLPGTFPRFVPPSPPRAPPL